MKWATMMALVCTTGLTACGGSKDGKDAEGTEAGKAAQAEKVPEGTIFYSQTDHAKAGDGKGTRVKIEKLAFNEKITDVAGGEFEGNPHIKEVYFTTNFLNVGVGGFASCPNLETVKIFKGVVVNVFNDEAFKGCPKLKSIDGHVQAFGLDAMNGCTSLESVITYDDLSQFRTGAFANCPNLKTVILGMPTRDPEAGAFKGSDNIEEISIPHKANKLLLGEMKDKKNLKTIYLLSNEVYEFPASANGLAVENIDLYVMDNLVDGFKKDAKWSQFKSIQPLSKTKWFKADGLRK